jgi:hypothetical protein
MEGELEPGTPVVLYGSTWGRVVEGCVIVQFPSGALAAVPVEDLEPAD